MPVAGVPHVAEPSSQTSSLFAVLRAAAADIKLAHSVFALPFAVLACFLARPATMPASEFALALSLIVACMVTARTWAMLVNRIADRDIDAANPRTARRAIPAGRLTTRHALLLCAGSIAAFLACCAGFWVLLGNVWPLIFGVPVLGWIALYSFTKRFTFLAHVFLGSALALSPLCAAVAINPASVQSSHSLWLLSAMVLLWVAGFDVVYALQDLDFDRSRGLHSIPAKFGRRGAAWISRGLHAGAFACLVLAWRSDPRLGVIFGIAVGLAGALLVMEHVVLARKGLAGLDMAFFTLNGIVSCVLGAAGVADVLL
jgi:4-hydroxybenzoate polyprenyltransferase